MNHEAEEFANRANGEALPKGWVASPLGDVVEIWDNLREPVNAKERASRQGPYPYYGANGQAGTIDGYKFDGDYALIAEDGGNFDEPQKGVAYRVTGKFWVNNHAHVLKASCGMTSSFLVHLFNSMDWMPFVSGTTRLKLNQAKLKSAPLKVPPLAEQTRIVSAIESLQERSSRARNLLAEVGPLISQLRQSVLRSAFSGRLTADWRKQNPDVEPASELLQKIRVERRQRWESEQLKKYEAKGKKPPKNWQDKYKEPEPVDESKLPELPKGWCWAPLSILVTRVKRGPSLKCNTDGVGIRYITSGNLLGGELRLDFDQKYLSNYDNVDSCQLNPGDVILNCVNSLEQIGKSAVFDQIHGEAIVGFNNYGLEILESHVHSEFLNYFFQCTIFRNQIVFLVKKAINQVSFATRELHLVAVPVPTLDEQVQIAHHLKKYFDLASRVDCELPRMESSLTQLDQSILAKAFRGELVPQDPRDEPASELLARIRASRETDKPKKKRRRK